MRMRIIPTKICSCCALALTPASPTIPIARPAAYSLILAIRQLSLREMRDRNIVLRRDACNLGHMSSSLR